MAMALCSFAVLTSINKVWCENQLNVHFHSMKNVEENSTDYTRNTFTRRSKVQYVTAHTKVYNLTCIVFEYLNKTR